MSWLRVTQATAGGVRQVAAAAALRPPGSYDLGSQRTLAAPRDRRSPRDAASAHVLQRFSLPARTTVRSDDLSETLPTAPPVARDIARAALERERLDLPSAGPPPSAETTRDTSAEPDPQPPSQRVSIVVHGTAAYPGAWWRPGGDFHEFLRGSVSPELYAEGQYFQGSGAYSARHRDVAAERLREWATPYGLRLHRIFAHSHGGVIALRAIGLGLEVDDLVLLSTPNERVETDYSRVGRIVSLRIHFDLVLLAARRRQSFDLPVAEFHLPRWFVGHGDTHEPDLWREHDIGKVLSL